MRGLSQRARRETHRLREAYAHDEISLLELEEAIDEALENGDPIHEHPDARRRRARRRAVALACVVGAAALAPTVVVTINAATAVPTGPPTNRWAKLADAVCDEMMAGYRVEGAFVAPPSGPTAEVPLEELARIRRAGVAIERTALDRLQSLPAAPDSEAVLAMTAFEDKIAYEVKAVVAAERESRAGFELAMRQSIPSAIAARDAFAETGASSCSNLM